VRPDLAVDEVAEAANRNFPYTDVVITRADRTYWRVAKEKGAGMFFIHVDEFEEIFGKPVRLKVQEMLDRSHQASFRMWLGI